MTPSRRATVSHNALQRSAKSRVVLALERRFSLQRGLQPRRQDPRRRCTAAAWCCGTWRRRRLADEPLPVKEGDVRSVAFSPDGKTIAAGYAAQRRRRRGPVGRRPRAAAWRTSRSPWTRATSTSVAFSPDGKTIAAGYARGGGGGVVLWDVAVAPPPGRRAPPRGRGRGQERGLQPRRQDPRRRIRPR